MAGHRHPEGPPEGPRRPISTRISLALAPLRLSPDLVSIVAFLMALAAAGLLALDQGVLGGILVQAASVVDGVDGEGLSKLGRVGAWR